MKKVLITGAAGFIGFHLARVLASQNHLVIGFDNFNAYYDPQLKRKRAEQLSDLGVLVREGDICDFEKLLATIREFKPTHIVHLAAQAGVRYSISHPHEYIQANLTGFLNVLECCKLHPEIKLTYASSSSVYGRNKKIPFSVDDPTDTQSSLYGVTKKTNELMAGTYHHLYGISTMGLRFFTVYGPWGRPDMAYYSFSQAILAGEPIQIYNHGKLKRDFTYIDDIVDGIIAALDLQGCEIFNLGNHQPVELLEFVSILEEALKRKAKKQFVEMQAGDVEITYADISHSNEKLGFYPKISIREGLNRFADWFLEYHFQKW